ncbi:MBL fold metallo-hydrolase [Spirosoma sp. KUDC1026]|uniref:MBL fold metallo-hydrolase n=1 Tax=Spirosoma sp. KUDC1026 TaxID=2745947 RepID=UPI00159BD902|nr:MBL fold metallo-hydrolase [Spirosoma sp. KUDC1026]QKZ15092.1 MBL fold metallo-hydrolase [Spirosoma sp. KUDC1026]
MESQLELDTPVGTGLSSPYDVTADVAGLKTLFVNVFFIGEPGPGNPWVLVDAGFFGYADSIRKKAEELFGAGTRPKAIVLTHGHADHVGSLKTLLETWDVPVYAHPLELPYLQGKSSYPPPDPGIGGGGMAYMSWVFPIGPMDFGDKIKVIASNGQIPELPDWRVIHTPGHAPGHISLFRDRDRTLIAGDAFVTTNQNAITAVATQSEEFHGPPAYFTCDWEAAQKSVELLNNLNPKAAGTGHGVSVRGLDLELGLNRLAHDFKNLSIPSEGRYVKQPAITDETGIVDMPTPTSYNVARAIGVGMVLSLVAFFFWPNKR